MRPKHLPSPGPFSAKDFAWSLGPDLRAPGEAPESSAADEPPRERYWEWSHWLRKVLWEPEACSGDHLLSVGGATSARPWPALDDGLAGAHRWPVVVVALSVVVLVGGRAASVAKALARWREVVVGAGIVAAGTVVFAYALLERPSHSGEIEPDLERWSPPAIAAPDASALAQGEPHTNAHERTSP